jgi:hypothetical protein
MFDQGIDPIELQMRLEVHCWDIAKSLEAELWNLGYHKIITEAEWRLAQQTWVMSRAVYETTTGVEI